MEGGCQLHTPGAPEVRVQRSKVFVGSRKEADDPICPFPVRSEGPAFKCRAPRTFGWMGLDTHQAVGFRLPEGQRLGGTALLLSPQGDPSREEAMPGVRVRGPVGGTERSREAGGRGLGTGKRAHPPPPAATGFQSTVLVVGVGGPAAGVRPCPAGNAGSRAIAWGSRGAGRRRQRGPRPAPGAAATQAAPRRLRSRLRHPPRPPR